MRNHQTPSQHHFKSRATRAGRDMRPHRCHLMAWQRCVEVVEMLRAKDPTVHRVGLGWDGMLTVPAHSNWVPPPLPPTLSSFLPESRFDDLRK